jgi:hypothetical protein
MDWSLIKTGYNKMYIAWLLFGLATTTYTNVASNIKKAIVRKITELFCIFVSSNETNQ